MISTGTETTSAGTPKLGDVVVLSYHELVDFPTASEEGKEKTLEKVGIGFGSSDSSLGICCVTGVPGMEEKRQRLLPMARTLARLPQDTLGALEDAKSYYSVGWSHGKEIFAGKPDFAKGSFYANPLNDDLGASRNVDSAVQEANGGFFAKNIWPSQDSVPDMEEAFKDMALLVVEVGRLLAVVCDAYVVQQWPEYPPQKLQNLLKESQMCKGRLLHYFAAKRGEEGEQQGSFDSWCGWHQDHGSLTGLVPAIYIDEDGNQVPNPDKSAGLYVQSRKGEIVKASLPAGALGYQIGETSQIHTGGVLQATPHAVRGCASVNGVTRETLAVFMEPEFDGEMSLPPSKKVEDVQDASIELPSTVSTLASRWRHGMNFGEFSQATFAAFY